MSDPLHLPPDAPDLQALRSQADAGFPTIEPVLDRPQVRILPAEGLAGEDQSPQAPTPDENIVSDDSIHIPEEWDALTDTILPKDPTTIEVNVDESDTGTLLSKVLEKRRWKGKEQVRQETFEALREAGTKGAKLPQTTVGHPKYDIDERVVRAMSLVGGTYPEMAAFFGCSEEVLKKRYAHIIRESRASRTMRIRQAQYITAVEEHNPTMLIWLGKQELGQFDESRMRVGDLNRFTDEELAQLAQGKVPGSLLGAGKKEGDGGDREK